MNLIEINENFDNTGTLYEDVLKTEYGEDAELILLNTKFLRSSILNVIKNFVKHEKTICIKEFSDKPIMEYIANDQYDSMSTEFKTDLIIVSNAFSINDIDNVINNLPVKLPLVLEALDTDNISLETWDNYLDTIYSNYKDSETPVHKIIFEDIISILKKWNDLDNQEQKDMIKNYNRSFGIEYEKETFWQEPLYLIAKNYWKKFSFSFTINDYDIYNAEYDSDLQLYLDAISERYFNNGYVDEVVININYFYWFDDFQKIIDWTEKNLKSTLVSYRFNTIATFKTKNRYYNEEEANKFNDVQRKNSMDEELEMFETRLPLLLDKILTNPQTFGFELKDGYFGKEGELTSEAVEAIGMNKYKEIICKIINNSPFYKVGSAIAIVFNDIKKKFFVCMKGID